MTDHGPKGFADVEHRGFVPLTFTDGDTSVERDGVKGAPHGFNGCIVGGVFVPLAPPCSTGDGGLVNGFEEVVSKVSGCAHNKKQPRRMNEPNGRKDWLHPVPLRAPNILRGLAVPVANMRGWQGSGQAVDPLCLSSTRRPSITAVGY